MSALPPKADIAERRHHVRFVPSKLMSGAAGAPSRSKPDMDTPLPTVKFLTLAKTETGRPQNFLDFGKRNAHLYRLVRESTPITGRIQ
jgi:hypothetical protein